MVFLRTLVVALIGAVLAVADLAGPAFAHGRRSESTNFSSRILDTPGLPGVTWAIHGGDQFLAVTNTSATELAVPGYEDEPYLRVGPDGVFQNVASKAAYLNGDRYGDVATFPPNVGADQEPRWTKLSDGPTYAWYDHRIHWMRAGMPPGVADPSRQALVNAWEVPFTYGGEEQMLSGELLWVPAPSPVPWLAGALLVTAPALLGLRRRPGAVSIRQVVAPAAAVLLVVSVLNLTHLADDVLAVPASVGTKVVAALQTALFIALGLVGAVVSRRGRDGAFTALGVGSVAILVGQGLLYLDALTRTSSVRVFPDWWTRVVISLSIAQALWVGAVAVIGNRRLAGADREQGVAGGEVVAI